MLVPLSVRLGGLSYGGFDYSSMFSSIYCVCVPILAFYRGVAVLDWTNGLTLLACLVGILR